MRARVWAVAVVGAALAMGCGFDTSLREYLTRYFWMPFAKGPEILRGGAATAKPYAGMGSGAKGALGQLRTLYADISVPIGPPFDEGPIRAVLAKARAEQLTAREREEVDLIDAKIDLRLGGPELPEALRAAQTKLQAFLKTAKTPEYLSEARGWLARAHYLLGNQTAAGKIYLDELERKDSNLTRDVLLNSLRILYGRDGGPELKAHLEEYFDTAEHAAFAISLVTNARQDEDLDPAHAGWRDPEPQEEGIEAGQILGLLKRHARLFESEAGANQLALLSMRVALRAGQASEAAAIAARVPARAAVRTTPDFLWMLGSARFLSKDFAGAEAPLLRLFEGRNVEALQRAAAAYGLCGVYRKLGRTSEQLRVALWLRAGTEGWAPYGSDVHWAASGWDANLLLDQEVGIPELEEFLRKYPQARGVRLARYALAVHLTRASRYREAGEIYAAIGARPRAARMAVLAGLQERIETGPESGRLAARLEMAQLLFDHSCGVYFNDSLWHYQQRYALTAQRESRMSAQEKQELVKSERRLKDAQEEYWQAYLLLADVRAASDPATARQGLLLSIKCLDAIALDRFGRAEEIHLATQAMVKQLKQLRGAGGGAAAIR